MCKMSRVMVKGQGDLVWVCSQRQSHLPSYSRLHGEAYIRINYNISFVRAANENIELACLK